LAGLIRQGLFREDLYYRIAVVTVRLPLLRERLEDLPELCRYYLDIFNRQKNKRIRRVSPEAFKKMYAHAWPGNVRELRNAMERAVLFCDGPEIRAEHVIFESAEEKIPASADGRRERRPINASKTEILALIRQHAGVVDRVAGKLNVTRRALYYHFRKLKIDPNRYRKNPHR